MITTGPTVSAEKADAPGLIRPVKIMVGVAPVHHPERKLGAEYSVEGIAVVPHPRGTP